MHAIVTCEIGQSPNLHHIPSPFLLPFASWLIHIHTHKMPHRCLVFILCSSLSCVHAPLFYALYFHVRSPPATLGLVKERAPTLLHHCGPCCWAPQAVPISPTWHARLNWFKPCKHSMKLRAGRPTKRAQRVGHPKSHALSVKVLWRKQSCSTAKRAQR